MELKTQILNGIIIAELDTKQTIINEVQDAVDLLGNASYLNATKVIIHESNLHPDFFNLKTGIAGEILQKFTNYRMQLAIIGDYSKYSSKSLKDFIFESNKHGRIMFLSSREEAYTRLMQ